MKKLLVFFLIAISFVMTAQATNITDLNFEQALIDLGYDSGPPNHYVRTEDIKYITTLDISTRKIYTLNGIQDFISLKELDCHSNWIREIDLSNNKLLVKLNCSYNYFTSLDLSKYYQLKELICSNNKLTSLDLSKNTLLQSLDCSANKLTSLDISKNYKLKELNCDNNKLASLIISKNIFLEYLNCSGNQLSGLNITKNTALKKLVCSYNQLTHLNLSKNPKLANLDLRNNPNLFCIQVSDSSLVASNKYWKKDANAIYSEDCGYFYYTIVPDDNFERALIDLGYDKGPLNDSIPLKNIDSVTFLNVGSRNISDLTGIEDFISLITFDCSANQLIKLDITMNTALKELECSSNELTSLDISENKALEWLSCSDNKLKKLDLRKNPLLSKLITRYNSDLSCIQVLNPSKIENDPDWHKDPWTIYSVDCGYPGEIYYTYIPDDRFEQAIIYKGYDFGPLDDFVPRENIDTVHFLDVSLREISDLTGIEDFIALNELYCYSNLITSLDLFKNSSLIKLNCSNNKLSSLGLSRNYKLKELFCDNNQLMSLELDKNTVLQTLDCFNNQLTSLDIKNSFYLISLNCYNNQLTSLDISNSYKLNELNCYDNKISSLDLSKNTFLKLLSCSRNQLTSLALNSNGDLEKLFCYDNRLIILDISNNPFLENVDARNNPNLYCIKVSDTIQAAENKDWKIDDWAIYSEDCGSVGMGDYRYESNGISISPNPSSDYIEINLERWSPSRRWTPSEIKIYNSLGQCVINYELRITNYEKERIDVSGLPPGVYYIRIGDHAYKFIKI